jgi:hypothetical protein
VISPTIKHADAGAGPGGIMIGLVANMSTKAQSPWNKNGAYGIIFSAAVATVQPKGGAFAQGLVHYTTLAEDNRTYTQDNKAPGKPLDVTYTSVYPTAYILDANPVPAVRKNDPFVGDPGIAANPNWAPGPGDGWTTSATVHYGVDTPQIDFFDPSTGVWNGVMSASMNDAFTTYIMYKPPGGNSSWVPLQCVSYSFQVSGTVGPTGLTAHGASQDIPDAFSPATAEPQWNHKNDATNYKVVGSVPHAK